MSRRLKVVTVTAELLQHMMTTGVKPAVVVDGLPPTATLDNARYDPLFGRFDLRFHDDSFPEVAECCECPALVVTVRQADACELERAAFDRGWRVAQYQAAGQTDAPTAVIGG